jgi:hypothetical protein
MATKPLKRIANELWHCINGEKILGPCSGLYGEISSGLRGDCSGLYGDCSGLVGNCSGLYGDCSGLYGDCSEIPAGDRPSQLEDWVAD